MVSKQSRRIKLSVNLRPFVSRVVRNGASQRAFAENIGRPVGGCVASRVRTGMSGAQIHNIARDCAKGVRGKTYSTSGYAQKAKAGRVAAGMSAMEAYEVE